MEGVAKAVCDGAYKSGKVAAAWFIEGKSVAGQIKGWNWVPGGVLPGNIIMSTDTKMTKKKPKNSTTGIN
jgi:hypothetical protein